MSRSLSTSLLFTMVAGAASSLPGQQPAADQGELPSALPSFLEVTGRTQQFLSAETIGMPQGGSITLHGIWLRHDGPSVTTSGVAHTLNSLTIRVGSTHRSPHEIGTVFAQNLGKPLVTAFSATNYTIPIDPANSETAQPWGAANGELHFPFAAPIQVDVAATGSLVIEFEVHSDPAHVPGDTNLDFAAVAHEGHLGTAISEGLSCGYPSTHPVVETDGDYDIGTSFRISGSGFTPDMPVATWATALLTPPVMLPGSFCWSYLDLTTGSLVQINSTDANGSFGGDPPFPIPPSPPLCGSILYLQSAGLTHQSAMNALGIETSNYRTIKIGCRSSEPLPGWYVTRPGSWSASTASVSRGGVLALRVQ